MVLGNLLRSARPIFVTSILYRIIAFIVFTPIVSGLTWLFLTGSGRIVVSNEEIASFILEPIGIVALIVMASVGLTLLALEQACLMVLLFDSNKNALPMAISSLKYVLVRSHRILELAGRIVVKTLLIAAPFLALVLLIYVLFLTEHDINFYLTEQPPVFRWALAGSIFLGIGLFVSLLIFITRVLFALPILLFEMKSPKASLKNSVFLSSENRLRIASALCIWGMGLFIAVTVAGVAFVWLGKLLVPLTIGYTTLLLFCLGGLFLALTLTQLTINIFGTAGFSVLIMDLYYNLSSFRPQLRPVLDSDLDFQDKRKFMLTGRIIICAVVMLGIIAGSTGWLLISNVELEDRTKIIAHRGSSNAAPENTLAAIEQAITDKAHWVEIDVQRTADDKVVVVHDRDLMKIGGKPIVVTSANYSELSEIDVGSWFDSDFADQRIPTLDKVLDHCKGRIKVNIELKYYGWDEKLADRVITIVEQRQMVDEVVIMSLKLDAVDQVKKAHPGWKTGLLTTASLGRLTRTNADFLAVHSRMVTPGFVRRVRRAGKELMAWTVNDTIGMTKYFGMNIDGLITDEPALAVRLLEQRVGMDPIEKALLTLGLIVVGEIEHVDPKTDGV